MEEREVSQAGKTLSLAIVLPLFGDNYTLIIAMEARLLVSFCRLNGVMAINTPVRFELGGFIIMSSYLLQKNHNGIIPNMQLDICRTKKF